MREATNLTPDVVGQVVPFERGEAVLEVNPYEEPGGNAGEEKRS
jgi:hypothetical protein